MRRPFTNLSLMSEHELQRVEVLSRVLDGRMRAATAANVLAGVILKFDY